MIYNSLGSKALLLEGVHRFIKVQVDTVNLKPSSFRILPDTGAYLTIINEKDLVDVDYDLLTSYPITMEVGGVSVLYTLAKLKRMYIGKLQLFDVVFGISENNPINLLGTNVLECIDPLFEYSTGVMYYTQNNKRRPLAQSFPEWGCGKVYLQEGLNKQIGAIKTTNIFSKSK